MVWKWCKHESKCFPMCFGRPSSARTKIQEWLGRMPEKFKTFADFLLVSLSPSTRSQPGAERIRQGKGRLNRPPKTALVRIYLTENSNSENCILRPRRKEAPDRMPPVDRDQTCNTLRIKESAFVSCRLVRLFVRSFVRSFGFYIYMFLEMYANSIPECCINIHILGNKTLFVILLTI